MAAKTVRRDTMSHHDGTLTGGGKEQNKEQVIVAAEKTAS